MKKVERKTKSKKVVKSKVKSKTSAKVKVKAMKCDCGSGKQSEMCCTTKGNSCCGTC